MTNQFKLNWVGWDISSQSYHLNIECLDSQLLDKKYWLIFVTTITKKQDDIIIENEGNVGKYVIQDYELRPNEIFMYNKSFKVEKSVHLEFDENKIKGYHFDGKYIQLKNVLRIVKDNQILEEIQFSTQYESQFLNQKGYLKSSKPKDSVINTGKVFGEKYHLLSQLMMSEPRSKFQFLSVILLYSCSLLLSIFLLAERFNGYEILLFEDNEDLLNWIMLYVLSSLAVIPLLFIWFRSILKSDFAKIQLKPFTQEISLTSEIEPSQLFRGWTWKDLKNITFQVVACQVEKNDLKNGSKDSLSGGKVGKKCIIYSQTIDFIPKNQPIESFLKGTLDLEDMFALFYPPYDYSKITGTDIVFEIQFISLELYDFKKTLEGLVFNVSDFFTAISTSS